MEIYLTTSAPSSATATSTVPALQSLSAPALVADPTPARTAQPRPIRAGWPNAGLMPVSTTGAAPQHQDVSIAGFGGCDVTDTKFSVPLGPPSCSPPV